MRHLTADLRLVLASLAAGLLFCGPVYAQLDEPVFVGGPSSGVFRPTFSGELRNEIFLPPGTNGGVIDTADYVVDFAGRTVVFDVIVDELEWDKIVAAPPPEIVGNPDAEIITIVSFEGGVVEVALDGDPAPGFTVDLVDNRGVDQIIGPDDFVFSHGHPVLWDTSRFETNGQLWFFGFAPILSSDYDGDGHVAQGDLDLVLLNWGNGASTLPATWINQRPTEGTVDQVELDGVLLNWGNSSPFRGGASVPEPSTFALLLLAAGIGRSMLWFYRATVRTRGSSQAYSTSSSKLVTAKTAATRSMAPCTTM